MPRTTRKLASQVMNRPTGFVASATNLTGAPSKAKRAKPLRREGWQAVAWDWFDSIGEYRYSVNWVGNILSKATLTVLENGEPTQNQHALDALASLFGGKDGQSEMLRLLGIQFTVAGEAYIVGESGGLGEDDEWFVVAATELTRTGGNNWRMEGKEFNEPLVMRLWRPHPRKWAESDAPSRAVLNILAEIDGLTKHVAAQIDSRLAGAGLLLLPSEITFSTGAPAVEGQEAAVTAPNADTFMAALMETMSTAIANREDASALVPIIVQAAGEHLEKIRHVTFSTPLDEKSIELRAEAIRRLALGMDMPPEVLTGTADLNHWGSWQVEEAGIKAHTEPLLAVITNALSIGFLRPYLEVEGVEDPKAFSFGVDTSKMRLRPNRSKEALELYEHGELSGETLRRENGFEPDDKMTDDELANWFMRKVASGSTTPELVEAALRALKVPLGNVLYELNEKVAAETEVQEARPTPSLEEHPVREPPADLDDAATAAAEVMVFRALERAGNRLKNKLGSARPEGVAAADLYRFAPVPDAAELDDLLTDAWSCADRFSYDISVANLDSYARMLLTTGKPHDRDLLQRTLALVS